MSKIVKVPCAGYEINADWYEGTSHDRVMLVLQGFTSSRDRQAKFTEFMVNATGMSALVIDYTGHGDSPFELKDTRPAQHLFEVISAYDWIKDNYPNAAITVMGNSYGSFLSANLIQYRTVDKLVLRAPAIYRPEALYDLWSLRFFDEDSYCSSITDYRNDRGQMKKSPLFRDRELNKDIPVLVVAHEHDEVVPLETSRVYAESFDAEMIIAQGFRHAVSQSDITENQLHGYYDRIARWLNLF